MVAKQTIVDKCFKCKHLKKKVGANYSKCSKDLNPNKCTEYEAKKKKRKKYNNKTTMYNGYKYHSRREAEGAMWLDGLIKEGKIKSYDRQHKIQLKVNDVQICNHYVDFLVTLNDDRKKYYEIKGLATRLWAIKMKLVQALYPETPYLVNAQERELLL